MSQAGLDRVPVPAQAIEATLSTCATFVVLGVVDGTANPVGPDVTSSALIGTDDEDFAGDSYVMVQKYVHDLARWDALGADRQSRAVTGTLFFAPSSAVLAALASG